MNKYCILPVISALNFLFTSNYQGHAIKKGQTQLKCHINTYSILIDCKSVFLFESDL